MSPYAFAWNNPVLYNDPDGRNPLKNLLKKLFNIGGKKAVKTVVKKEVKQIAKKEIKDLIKSKKSFENLIKEHKLKLKEFNKDPIANSSKEALEQMQKDNPSPEVLLKRAQGRATALEKQIAKQEGELAKVNDLLSKAGQGSSSFFKKYSIFVGFVENVGTNVLGDNDFGKAIDELNPLNLGLAPLVEKAANSNN